MKRIAIHDYENSRILVLDLPHYVVSKCKGLDGEDTATLVTSTLGLSSGSCDWMDATRAEVVISDAESLVDDFKEAFESNYADAELEDEKTESDNDDTDHEAI